MKTNSIVRRALVVMMALVMGSTPLLAGAQQLPGRESVPCFDFYPYMALKISASVAKDTYAPGETAQLTLNVTNSHSKTSIVGGKALLQIRKYTPGVAETVLVQESTIGEGLDYPHGQSSVNNLTFTIPAWLPNGIYQGSIAITENGYNIAGLPFSQDNVGSPFAFQVNDKANKNQAIAFIKESQATINGNNASPFRPPVVMTEKDLPAKIVMPILNPGTKSVTGTLTAELYDWDQTRNKIAGDGKQITISAKGQASFEFVTPATLPAGTYMLRARYEANGQSAIAKIRFTIPGVSPDVFYSGIVSVDGVSQTVSCVGNNAPLSVNPTSTTPLPQGRVVVSVVDLQTGKVLASGEQKGALYQVVSPTLYRNTVATALPTTIGLRTEVYDAAGKQLMSREVTVQNPASAPEPAKRGAVAWYWYAIIALVVVLGGGAAWYWKKKRTIASTALVVMIAFASIAWLVATHGGRNNDIAKAQQSIDVPWKSVIVTWNSGGGWDSVTTADFSMDYIAPEAAVKGGDTFTVTKINGGDVTNTFTTNADPPLEYDAHKASATDTGTDTFTGRPYVGQTYSFPYTDTWVSDHGGVLTCTTVDADTARCVVDPNKSGGFSSDTPVQLTLYRNFSPINALTNVALSRTKTVMVKSGKPVVDLKINGSTAPIALEVPNTSATLSWAITGKAVSCELTGSLNQPATHDANNSLSLGTLERGTADPGKGKTYSYTMVCKSPEGFASDPKTVSATVYEYPKCSPTLVISPSVITLPAYATASWSCNYVNRCDITNDKDATVIPVKTSGDTAVGKTDLRPTTSTKYTMSCNGLDGTTASSASVRIGGEEGGATKIREVLP